LPPTGPEMPKTTPSQQALTQSQVNLLLVDDLPANLLAVRSILEGLGHNIIEARSGEEALRQLRDADFAVVLLDVQMAGLDGFQTARLIRSRERSRHTPIIFVSAYESSDFPVAEAYTLGAVDYLIKPLVPQILKAKVAVFVELFEQAQRAKRHGEQLRLLIEGTRDHAIIMLGPQGHILTWNPGAERIAGYRAEEIVGEHFSRFYPREDIEAGKPQRELEVVASQGKYEEEGWRLRKDGSRFWASVVVTALRDEAGNLRGFSKVTRDMTEHKKAEENARRLLQEQAARRAAEEGERRLRASEERFAQFMEHLPGLAWIKDLQGRYVYANEAAEKAFQTPRANLYGKTDDEVFPPETAAQFQENDRQAMARGAAVQVIETLEHEDGTLHHSIVSKFPIPGGDGKAKLVGGMAIDITDRMRMEEALKEADRLKDEFLAMLAHELRNPLAPIRNSLHIMKQPAADRAVLQRAHEMAERQVLHMSRLLDDLLDVSRISGGRIVLRKERVDISALVNRTVEASRSQIEERRHELTVSFPPEALWVRGDPTRLEQILMNLLSNACKYTDVGGHIWLSAAQEGAEVVLRVRDTGIGISPEMLPRIFDLFVQAERRLERSQGGVGIGLTLVQKLVNLHRGTVQAFSAGLGQGSEFVVRLPAEVSAPARDDPRSEDAKEIRQSVPRLQILVVDDNADAAESLATLLNLEGHDVRVAFDGAPAVQMASTERPDIIFLDIGMPGMDGYQVARRLRQQPDLRNLFLVALTGWGQEEDKRRSREAGFDAHLVKPAEPSMLQELLGTLANGSLKLR